MLQFQVIQIQVSGVELFSPYPSVALSSLYLLSGVTRPSLLANHSLALLVDYNQNYLQLFKDFLKLIDPFCSVILLLSQRGWT